MDDGEGVIIDAFFWRRQIWIFIHGVGGRKFSRSILSLALRGNFMFLHPVFAVPFSDGYFYTASREAAKDEKQLHVAGL